MGEVQYFPFTIASFSFSLIVLTILIGFLSILLRHKRIYPHYRLDFIFVLIIVIITRLVLPIDFPFTINISSTWLNPIVSALQYEVFQAIQLQTLLCHVWIAGSFIQLLRYGKALFKTRTFFLLCKEYGEETSTYQYTSYGKKAYPVILSQHVSTPQVILLYHTILLPKNEIRNPHLEHILAHEINHLENHDVFIKQMINLLCIVYWWFPLIYLFRYLTTLFIEMRADYQVAKSMDAEELRDYVNTLIDCRSRLMNSPVLSQSTAFFIPENSSTLSKRVQYLVDSFEDIHTSPILKICLCGLVISSSAFVLTPNFSQAPQFQQYYDYEDIVKEGSYILEKKDGTYELHFDNNTVTIQNPNTFHVPIVKEGE